MEHNADQTKENTIDVSMSEVQASLGMVESKAPLDPMGTIVSSPEAPATIDTEINPDLEMV